MGQGAERSRANARIAVCQPVGARLPTLGRAATGLLKSADATSRIKARWTQDRTVDIDVRVSGKRGAQSARLGMDQPGKQVDFSFDSGGLAVDDVARLTADMWADLAFDRDALAALKRDGLTLDGINLGGPNPYRFDIGSTGQVRVSAFGDQADTLLDLWRVHFLRGLRPRNLAA